MKKTSIKSKEKLKRFTFPDFGIVVEAKDIETATKEAHKIVSKK